MKELLYLEVPTPNLDSVRSWLHQQSFGLGSGEFAKQINTREGVRLQAISPSIVSVAGTGEQVTDDRTELSIFLWSLQRTTYLKVFRWGSMTFPQEGLLLRKLKQALAEAFPPQYLSPPPVDLSRESIFTALAETYPNTVKYFQRIPNGEYDLTRAYWWEQRWREGVRNPQSPRPVIFRKQESRDEPTKTPTEIPTEIPFDLIYLGGALGTIHATRMAQLGYRVLLVERLPFGRMNREWNISRGEFQTLIDLKLFTPEEFEAIVAAEYQDGFHKFFVKI